MIPKDIGFLEEINGVGQVSAQHIGALSTGCWKDQSFSRWFSERNSPNGSSKADS